MKVHVMGVGGTAMAAIAGMFRERGCEVRGSDGAPPYPPMSDVLNRLGIPVMAPYAPANLDWGPDLVIVGNVIRRTNPEAEALLASGRAYLSLPQALHDHFLAGHRPLVVAGTHGKTTTSSLVAHLLHAQRFDPGFMIGGIPLDFMSNYRLGQGPFFVVEGDEYDTAFFDKEPKFLHYAPQAAIINNIEFDHADIYRDLDHVVSAFAKLSNLMPPKAPLIVPAKDPNCALAAAVTRGRVVTFGLDHGMWQAHLLSREAGVTTFDLLHLGARFGTFSTRMLGDHNLRNITAALALIHEIEAETPALAEALMSFKGIRKRQEVKGVASGVTVIDDFAHHPTAVRETIRAVRTGYPGSRIIALFEPESNTSRRAVFQNDYVTAFTEADEVLFARPFEKPDNLAPEERIDMNRLCRDIESAGGQARMIADVDELAAQAVLDANPGDVILGMSGRDFMGIHDRVLRILEKR